jgi:TolB protein
MSAKRIIIGVVAIVVIGVAAGAFYLYQQLQGDPIPLGAPSGELAFMSNEAGDWDVMMIDSEGVITNLTGDDSGGLDYVPTWSFQGDQLNFLTNRTGEIGAGRINADGTGLRTLSIASAVIATLGEQRFEWDPVWSPTGEQLMWISLRTLNVEIMLGDGDAQNGENISNDGGTDAFQMWSPDGTQILFTSERDGNEEIYVMDADGSNIVRLTDSADDDTHPTWSEDGQSILFITERNVKLEDGDMEFYLMNVDGSDQRPLGDETFIGGYVFSADGQQIAYISNEEGDWNIYVKDADGENVKRLTESDADEIFPVWRPTPLDAIGG